MSRSALPNLAGRPFVNNQPVLRASIFLWIAALLLALLAAGLYWSYFSTREDRQTRIAQLERQIAEERTHISNLQDRLAAIDLENQNEAVDFLNERIRERTFGWSVLFDRLAGLQPDNVRVVSLSPRIPQQLRQTRRRRGRSRDAAGEADSAANKVPLQIQAIGRAPGSLEEMVDALFADAAFENPNPLQEARQGNQINFSLSVVYLPQVAAAEAEEALAAAAGGAP
ncbi:MAG: hypothetical protein AAF481_18325 [Acidobacteriota bacterium]